MFCTLATALLLMTACTKIETASAPGSQGALAGNAWTHHGELRMANLSDPDTLNPLVGNSQIDSDLAMFWGGFLFNWSDRNEFVPELATVVPSLANGGISADGLTFIYHLRPDVLWHDGRPFGADDVIFTWHVVMNPKNNVGSRVGYDLITAIDKKDDHTIVVHIKERWSPFVASFFTMSGTPYPILPKHLLGSLPDINRAEYNSQPIGTGPFVIDHWKRGTSIVFRANPHYWRGAPKLARIEYQPVPDENTIVTLLRTHEIDLEYNGSAALSPQLQNIPGTHLEMTPFNQFGQLGLNARSPILADVQIRRALNYALDKQAIITKISHGVNLLAWSTQPAFSWAFNPDVRQYPFDPAKAKALLDAAGWKPGGDGIRVKDGKRLSLTFANVAGSRNGTQVAILAQSQWHEAGVDLQIKNYPAALMLASYGAGGIIQNGKFDVFAASWIGGVDPDDSTLFMCDQIPPAGQNTSFYCNKTIDAAERIALHSYDRAVRTHAYAIVQATLADNVPLIVTGFVRRISVYNTDLKNYRPAHAVTSFWNSWEWSI